MDSLLGHPKMDAQQVDSGGHFAASSALAHYRSTHFDRANTIRPMALDSIKPIFGRRSYQTSTGQTASLSELYGVQLFSINSAGKFQSVASEPFAGD